MRAIGITTSGGPEVLEVREGVDPTPGPGQVRVMALPRSGAHADVLVIAQQLALVP